MRTRAVWSGERPLGRATVHAVACRRKWHLAMVTVCVGRASLPFAPCRPAEFRMIRSMTAFASGERTTPGARSAASCARSTTVSWRSACACTRSCASLEPVLRERCRRPDRARQARSDPATARARRRGGLQLNPTRLRELSELAFDMSRAFPRPAHRFHPAVAVPGRAAGAVADPAALQAQALALLDRCWMNSSPHASVRAASLPP
jgi:hypothetical protein